MAAPHALPKAALAATRRSRTLLLLRRRDATAPSAFVTAGGHASAAPALIVTTRQHNRSSNRNDNSAQRSVLLASSAAVLSLCATTLTDTERYDVHCESLQRLDPSNRRHTGSAPQKRLTPDDGGSSSSEYDCDVHEPSIEPLPVPPQQQTAYFDADYDTKSLVGAGTFGMVLQCVRKRDGRVAAVKMVQDVDDDARAEIARETQALASIAASGGHDHIVRFDGAYAHNGFYYVVTEFVAGDTLFAFLETRRRVDVRLALQLAAQLADALAFLQTRNIVHRDLKPENIMVTTDRNEQLTIKVIDFGSAACSANDSAKCESDGRLVQAPALSGTRCYWSPEALLHDELTPAMDVWALGCVLFILLAGRHPFDPTGTATEQEVVDQIVKSEPLVLDPNVWRHVPQDVQDLVCGLLEKDPRKRLGVDDVRAHASVRAACES